MEYWPILQPVQVVQFDKIHFSNRIKDYLGHY